MAFGPDRRKAAALKRAAVGHNGGHCMDLSLGSLPKVQSCQATIERQELKWRAHSPTWRQEHSYRVNQIILRARRAAICLARIVGGVRGCACRSFGGDFPRANNFQPLSIGTHHAAVVPKKSARPE
jgi:hypothetical protein